MWPNSFEVHNLTTSIRMSVLGVPHNHLETEYNEKHDCINDEVYLYFFQLHIRMSMVVTMTMAVMVTVIIDFTIPSCSSLNSGNEKSVKICYSAVGQAWAAVSEESHLVSLELHKSFFYEKDTQNGKINCQNTKHRTNAFHFLPIGCFHNVYKEVPLCPLIFPFISVEIAALHSTMYINVCSSSL